MALWESGVAHRGLTARAALRLLRVARTIADLGGQTRVEEGAIAEAFTYRSFDISECDRGGDRGGDGGDLGRAAGRWRGAG